MGRPPKKVDLRIALDELTTLQYLITNIKLSIKLNIIRTLKLSDIDCLLQEGCVNSKLTRNFLVVRDKYVYIIFPNGHVNITGFRRHIDIRESILIIKMLLSITAKIKKCNVDNISCKFKLPNTINLPQLYKVEIPNALRKSYNTERFPGMFLKYPRGTLIVFASGSIVAVGVKDVEGLSETVSHLWNVLRRNNMHGNVLSRA